MPSNESRKRSASEEVLLVPPPQTPTFHHQAALDTSHNFTFLGFSPAVIAIVASITWMAVSSGLILLNKDLLSHGFPYPMTLAAFGMIFSSVASRLVCRKYKLGDKKVITWQFWTTKILPVGFCMASTLLFGNLAYLYLTVSFIQILKCYSPVITMIALFVARLETPTRRLVLSVLVIALGTTIASFGELNFNLLGLIIMLSAEVFESMRLVMTQYVLTGLKFHPMEGLMYLAPACVAWLTLGILSMELRRMLDDGALYVVAEHPLKFFLASAMGFAVNALAYIVIQTASSLTLKVLGTVKNAIVVYLGIALLGDKISLMQGIGYAISLIAFYWYQQIKMEQIKAGQGAGSQPGTPMTPLRRTGSLGMGSGTAEAPMVAVVNEESVIKGRSGGGAGSRISTPMRHELKEQV